jgi:hypothetical protein
MRTKSSTFFLLVLAQNVAVADHDMPETQLVDQDRPRRNRPWVEASEQRGRVHGPVQIGDGLPCANLEEAVPLVNEKMNDGGRCQAWFDRHTYMNGPFTVTVHRAKIPCFEGIPTWGYPGFRHIGMCSWACRKGTLELASLLIHEVAHHYCPIGMTREACAISAQEECFQ